MWLFYSIVHNTLSEMAVYRLNFLLWRFRNVVSLLIKYYIWIAVYESQASLFGYSQSHMITYILLSSIISSLVLSTKTADVAGEIIQGQIIDYILRPLDFFRFQMARDAADKIINVLLQSAEIFLLYVLLRPEIFIQTDPIRLGMSFVFLVIGLIIAFFINLCISFIGFWTPEVWAPRFIFMMFVLVFSGSYFPLDIIPRNFYVLLFLTPFPYLFYVPTHVYLGMNTSDMVFALLGGLGWVFFSYYIARHLWKKGLREFSFFGR